VRGSPTDHVARDDRVGATLTAPRTRALTAWTWGLTGSASQLSIASPGLCVRELASSDDLLDTPGESLAGAGDAPGRISITWYPTISPKSATGSNRKPQTAHRSPIRSDRIGFPDCVGGSCTRPSDGRHGKTRGLELPRVHNEIGTRPPSRWRNAGRSTATGPAVKTSNPRPLASQRTSRRGGTQAWADHSGCRTSSCSTLLLSRAPERTQHVHRDDRTVHRPQGGRVPLSSACRSRHHDRDLLRRRRHRRAGGSRGRRSRIAPHMASLRPRPSRGICDPDRERGGGAFIVIERSPR
jgi:hypothetical protein